MAKDRNFDQWASPGRDSPFRDKLSQIRTGEPPPQRQGAKPWQQQTDPDITAARTTSQSIPQFTDDDLERMAFADPGTGLMNARTFARKVKYELKRGKRYKRPLALILLTIDSFQEIEGRCGKPGSEAILKACAERIIKQIREVDIAARFNESTLAIVMPETNAQGVTVVAERVRHAIRMQPITGFGGDLMVTVSIGMASFPAHAREYDELTVKAQHALDMAIEYGGNRVCLAQ